MLEIVSVIIISIIIISGLSLSLVVIFETQRQQHLPDS